MIRRSSATLAIVLSLVAAAHAFPDLPRASREHLRGAKTVWVEAPVGSRERIVRRIASDLPALSQAPSADAADIVLRFATAPASAFLPEAREVWVTKANPEYAMYTTSDREAGRPMPSPTIQVREKETRFVWKPVDRVTGTALRRLPSTALLPVLDYRLDAPKGLGPSGADAFAKWFVKQYRAATE
jgi:hypothetical protein